MRRFIIIAALAAAVGFHSETVSARSGAACHTRACLKRTCVSKACKARVWARQRPARRVASVSWYGPGLYGNALGCGGRLTPGTFGVAHKSLPCGARVRLCLVRCAVVRVVDRGPFVGGREFDLTAPVRDAIGMRGGVVTVRWGPA